MNPPATAHPVVFATATTLGLYGTGGPAARLREVLREEFPPSLTLCRGFPGGAPPEDVRVLPRPAWRRALAGTRLRFLAVRSTGADRREFDAMAARALPGARVVVAENSTGLRTLRRARAAGAATVLVCHNHHFREFREDLLLEGRRWGGPAPFITESMAADAEAEFEGADHVVCFSGAVEDSLAKGGVAPGKLRRARLGVDTARFRPAAAGPGEPFTVAFVGFLSHHKGYAYLVSAFRQAAIPGSRLLLHGGTDVAFHHRLVRRLAGSGNVQVVRGPVEETLARTSVLVLPSVIEAYGLSAMEGMACGLPVIVTDRCGVAEDITDGVDGFVVPARSPEAIATRLLELHAHPGVRRRVGEEARRTAEGHGWSGFREDMKEILRRALDGGTP